MIQITPQMKFRVYPESVDFRKGIDGLSGFCRTALSEDPFSGRMFLFRNRSATAVKILVYDEQGFWLCLKRLSTGRFKHWPKSEDSAKEMAAREISILLFNGDPMKSAMSLPWRRVG